MLDSSRLINLDGLTKTLLRTTAVSLTAGLFNLLFTPAMARADILAYEDFDYSDGALRGQDGGLGWSGAWGTSSPSTPNPVVVQPGTPLIATLADHTTVSGGDRAIVIDQSLKNIASRLLSSPIDNDNVFVSFMIRWDTGTINDGDFVGLWFESFKGSQAPNVGIKGNESQAGSKDVFIRPVVGSERFTAPMSTGVDYLIVGGLSKSDPGSMSHYDRFSLWVNPGLEGLGTPLVHVSGDGQIGQFSKLGIRTANLDNNDSVLFDRLIISSTWDEAVTGHSLSVPTPASLGMFAAGIGFALGRRQWARSRAQGFEKSL
jgi:hypothetical protein